ncbi:unnamed protein product [Adineta ricciae]|uniref:Uncharacterized protein n=1 Tax=Adineta ricciae TaxID=249248 RepID=A0A813RJT1_ADIRI|nr:unnamed protein product [Adineta ricciae]
MMKFLFITTLFVLITHVTSFDCYDCQNCQIPFNNQTSTSTCNSGVTSCMKITAKLGTVYTYVSKQCGPCSSETFLFGVTYIKVDCCYQNTYQASLAKYFSITSSDELLTPPSSLEYLPIENLSQNQSAFSMLFNSLANRSKRLRKKEESFGDKNLNPNHTVLDMESVELINRSKHVSHP